MSYTCLICKMDPSSHSFTKISEEHGICTFYTCPRKATKYWDCPGILAHYEGVLNENNGQPWIWHFDCTGLEMKHVLEMNTALGIADLLVKKHGESLQKIVIINPTWYIHMIINVIWPFLNDHIRSLITDK